MLTNNSRLLGRARLLGRSIFTPRVVVTVGLVTLAAFGTSPAVQAKALTFDSSPVTDAVAQINRTFNAHIVIRQGVNSDALVSFTVPDITEPGARLDAINDLANALKADYTKSFVISTVTADEPVPDPVLDAPDAPVYLTNATTDAADVIRTIASIDDASVQFYSPVHGTVSIPDKRMTASDAAREVARQTHTIWKTVYTIAPRSARSAHADGAKIIGYTASGSPITELATETFRPSVDPEAAAKAEAAKAAADASKTGTSKPDAADQSNQAPVSPYGYGYGYSPYGYSGYYGYGGYNPGPFGYGGNNGSPMVIGPGSGLGTGISMMGLGDSSGLAGSFYNGAWYGSPSRGYALGNGGTIIGGNGSLTDISSPGY